jgi:hypothetical protein
MERRLCPSCERQIAVNGVGTNSSKWGGRVSRIVNKIYPVACKLFEEPANVHDLSYHIYQFGKTVADLNFYHTCLTEVKNSKHNRLVKKWLKYQAKKFYLAVKYGGDSAYESAQRECLRNLCQGEDPKRKMNRDKLLRKVEKTERALGHSEKYFQLLSESGDQFIQEKINTLKNRLIMINRFKSACHELK